MTETMTKVKADLSDILETLDDLVHNFEGHRDRDHDVQKALQEQVRDLFHVTVGIDGRNGLRSKVIELEDKMQVLEKWRYQTFAVLAVFQVVVVPVIISFILKYIK